MKLKLAGVADTQKMLQLLEERVARKGVRKALRVGAEVMKDAIVEVTPVLDKKTARSTSLEPGALKEDIAVRMATVDGQPVAYVGPGKDTARVARWVEYGHRMVSGGYSKVVGKGRVRGPGKARTEDVPAHPFIRPAYEATKDAATKAIAAEVANQVKEVRK